MMRIEDNRTCTEPIMDADLVAGSLSGDREAFGRIVERYQRLLCSLAFSATGNLTESEDLAQEVFIEAWHHLSSLREPEKLRGWLCGILRHKIHRLRRSAGREPDQLAEGAQVAEDLPSSEEPVLELTMGREEQAILWRALEQVPTVYREPLILYYREHRSVEHVAASLDLSEDAVKQRLARGRKLLQESVLAFVEGALSRSTPGRVFTVGVLAALPALAPPAKAAGIGIVASQGGLAAKTTGLAGLLSSASGAVSAVLMLRVHLDQARTPRERRAVVRVASGIFATVFGLLGFMYLSRFLAILWPEWQLGFAWASQAVVLVFSVAWPLGLLRMMSRMREMRTEERRCHPDRFRDSRDQIGSSAGEYRSRWSFFGVPLVHIRFASPEVGDPPVMGWVAGGDRAYGLLFAFGGLAVAPVSVGAVAVGFLTVGTLGIGVLALGTVGIGVIAIGCMACGMKAFGWLSALGWDTASGSGFSIARTAAEGPVAFAQHANDLVARQLLADPNAERGQMVFAILVSVLSLGPILYYAREVRRRLGGKR